MAITKKDKDPTRAGRKLKKRKLEEAISDLPGDAGTANSQDPSTPTKEGRGKSFKRRKLGESSTHDIDMQQGGENEHQQKKNQEEKAGKRAVKDNKSHADEIVKSSDKASDSDHIDKLRSGKLGSIHGKLEREIEVTGDSTAPIDEDPPAKKSKNQRKAKRKTAEAAQAAASNKFTSPPTEDTPVASGEAVQSGKSKKNNRNRKKKRKDEGKAQRFIVFIGKLDDHFACSFN
jgi:nucleolar protein 6